MTTKSAVRVFLFALFAGSALIFLSSCETDDTPKPPGERYNTQGWNRPEAWEGGAGFGPLPQSR